ncbi:MAG: hypothetical protein ACJ8AH_04510 [Stellaceae bacterium]
MFKLAASLAASRGVYCGREGLYLGPVALIEESEGTYRLRPEEEIAAIFSAAYNACPEFADRIAGLRRIAAALQRSELAQAMISALLLRLDAVSDEGLARIEVLSKANFNPNQPRDAQGRWTPEGLAPRWTQGRALIPRSCPPRPSCHLAPGRLYFSKTRRRRFGLSRSPSRD